MLYICATPIGNLEDITLRVLRILAEVDLIVAEDTRTTGKLLQHYKLKKPMVSLHQHNEMAQSQRLIQRIQQGESIAVVSDAGLPGISDPGERLIRQAVAASVPLTVLPGANAALTALVQSGLPSGPFFFQGFLPAKRQARERVLESMRELNATLVFYEAPHRLLAMLESMHAVLGDRQASVCRELTKMYEQVCRGTIHEHLSYFRQKKPRGEFVVVVDGCTVPEPTVSVDTVDLRQAVIEKMATGMEKKEAIKETAHNFRLPKNAVYQACLDIDQTDL